MKKALQNKYINIHYHLINLQKNKMKQENIPRSLYILKGMELIDTESKLYYRLVLILSL